MFWATNTASADGQPVMMLGVDANLVHKIDVIPKSKGVANCSIFKEPGDKPECESADERPIVSYRNWTT